MMFCASLFRSRARERSDAADAAAEPTYLAHLQNHGHKSLRAIRKGAVLKLT